MAIHPPPDFGGASLLNLANELERRLIGSSPHAPLSSELARAIPEADTYVVVLFDGLGARQLGHRSAKDLSASLAGTMDAPFPTTTTVSLATLATGLTPAEHGLLGYLLWEPEAHTILNTIHMTSAWGDRVVVDLDGFLPDPNLWERLASHGIEPVVVQPFNFDGSPLTRVLYRGARFEAYVNPRNAVDVTRDVAGHANRLILLYVPFVDVAAHLSGQQSEAYEEAMTLANLVWTQLVNDIDDDVTLLGTADHGHIDIADASKTPLDVPARVFGDGRALYITGDAEPVIAATGGTWMPAQELESYLGGAVAEGYRGRMPDGVVMMPDGTAAFTRYMNDRLIGHHGGLSVEEREIPLLVRA